jgi:hypothetical protein
MRSRVRLPLAVGAVLVLAACGGGGGTAAAPSAAPAAGGSAAAAAPAAPAGGPLDLAGAGCPATVVMQQDWQPEAEHGAMYALVGPDKTVDTNTKSVKGSLVAQGVDTGVDIEVRSGGPNTGFQTVPALMYLDEAITLGAVNTDQAMTTAAAQPTVAVTSQMTISPQMLMWDPASHPGMNTIREVAASGATVLTSGDTKTISSLLISKGVMKPEQSDTGYQSTPERFVADPTILQQGFATAEPYIYENEIPQWDKPVKNERLYEYGFTIYPEPLAVRADKLEQLRPCLAKLVPVMQRSQLDYLADPGPTNQLIIDLVNAYQTGWTYSQGVADFSVKTQKEGGFVANDPASGVFGKFDPARMKEVVDTFWPIFAQEGTVTGAAPDPATLYTNDFIDNTVKMS